MKLGTLAASLGVRISLLMSVMVAATVALLTYLDYSNAREGVISEAHAKLESVAHLKIEQLKTLLAAIDLDLRLQSQSRLTSEAIVAFTEAFHAMPDPERALQRTYIEENPHPTGEKDKLVWAGTPERYDMMHARFHPFFHRLQQGMGYYDVFLFDLDGNLVYSVFKELDYATNMNTGAWKDTDLANVFRGARDLPAGSEAVFEDFAPYGPSHGAAAAFMARPVFDDEGERVGVLAYQMPVEAWNAAIQNVTGLGETGEAFVVGADGLMRSDLTATEEDEILTTRIERPEIMSVFDGTQGLTEYVSDTGTWTVAYVAPMEFLGTTWVVAVQQHRAELLSQLNKLLTQGVQSGLLMFAVAVALTSLLARTITRPINDLVGSVERISRKEYDIDVAATERRDVIGDIARAIDTFREGLATAAKDEIRAAFKEASFEMSGAPMILADTDFNISELNNAAKRMMQQRAEDFRTAVPDFDPDNLIGKNMDIFHARPGKARTSLSNDGNLPVKMKIAIGEAYLGLYLDRVLDKDGNKLGYVLEWKDQTWQMANQTIIAAIDSNQCRMETRLAGDVKFVNDTMCAAIDRTADSIIGKDIAQIVAPLDGDTGIWERVKAGESVFASFRVGQGAAERILDGSLSPIPDHRGKPNGFLLLGIDATDNHATMEAAEARRKRMEADQAQVVDAMRVNLKRMSSGDLTCRIEETFSDDYEQLRVDFNHAVDGLLDAMKSVVHNADQIDSEAGAISSAVNDLSRRTERQAATLEETAAAVEELTASVTSAAKGAQDAANIATEARSKAEASGEVVGQTVAAMNEIERSSHEISKIISVIDDIAFQTNLLALNAGVEAARAGEAGRGFAVVATEVRALAQRSSDAAREINELISASEEQVQSGVELVDRTGTALAAIVESISEISGLVSNIALSTKEQASGLNEINSAVNELDQVTQQNAAMFEETTAASHALTSEADSLAQAVARFDLGAAGMKLDARPAKQKPVPTATRMSDAPTNVVPASGAATQGSAALKVEPDTDGWEEF